MYWVVLACALLFESWVGFILVWYAPLNIRLYILRIISRNLNDAYVYREYLLTITLGFLSMPGFACSSSYTSSFHNRKALGFSTKSTSIPGSSKTNIQSTSSYHQLMIVQRLRVLHILNKLSNSSSRMYLDYLRASLAHQIHPLLSPIHKI